MSRELHTASEIIDKIGGNSEVATLTGRKTQHVSNWRAAGRLPSDTFLIVSKRLEELGFTASPELWSITPAEPERQSA